jgi:hypothetical protein
MGEGGWVGVSENAIERESGETETDKVGRGGARRLVSEIAGQEKERGKEKMRE